MRGTRLLVIGTTLLWGACLAFAQADFFPLHVGNQWVYRGAGTRGMSSLVIEITRTAELEGRTYWRLEGFPGDGYWVRKDDAGTMLAYDPERKLESVWYAFQAQEQQVYATTVPGNCCGRAVISSRKQRYAGPIGQSDNALEIGYPDVFQVGIERELFLPYIGLVYRNQATGGPTYVAYELGYARIGGVTVVSQPELSFGLSLDRTVFVANLMPPVDPRRAAPEMIARITLRNTARPVQLAYPSGQDYDLIIRDEKGQAVYQWSQGKTFAVVFRNETFGPGQKDFLLIVRLADAAGQPLPQGQYVAEAWLATQPRQFAASVGFEIRHIF